MHEDQRVADMANEVLARQAQAHAKQTGEAFEDALESVLKTEAGRLAWEAARWAARGHDGGPVAGGSHAGA